jgi:hypothetical protein
MPRSTRTTSPATPHRPGNQAGKTAGEPDPSKFGGAPFSPSAGETSSGGGTVSRGGGFASYMRRHPKGKIWAIVGLVAALLSFFVFLISVPFQLIHMAKILLDHNFGPGDRIEQIAGRRLIARLFQARAADPATGAQKSTGHPISDKIANMKIDRFNRTLGESNLKMSFDSAGRLTGITNTSTGKTIKDFSDASFVERRTAVSDLVSEHIAPWRVLKRLSYTKLMRFHARVSFQFWPKEKVKDIKKLLATKVKVGASTAEILDATKGTAAQQAAAKAASATDGTGDAAEAAKATSDWFEATKDKVGAIKAGSAKLLVKSAATFGITGIVSLICTVQQMIDDAVNKGYTDRLDNLMRAGNLLSTQMSQLYTGKNLDLDSFNQLMTRFNGDSDAPIDSVDHKDWSQSAAAKRINGESVDPNPKLADGRANINYNPDLSPAANPDSVGLMQIRVVMDAILNAVPGKDFICAAATGFIGIILQVGELILTVVTGTLYGAAATVAKTVASIVIFNTVVPWALEAATNLAVTGTENAADTFNNADAGSALSAEDYHRSYGGRGITDTEQVALVEAAAAENVQIAKSKGWFYRNLDVTNIHSVASNLLVKVPTSPTTAIAAITSLPKSFTAYLGTILTGNFHSAYAATASTVNPYNFQFYGFTQAELDQYPDLIANEAYLAQPVPGTTVTRLSALGDSSTYVPPAIPGGVGDPNMDDLLHCFVNVPTVPSAGNLTTDPICQGIGVMTSPGGSATHNPTQATIEGIYAKAGLGGKVGYDNDFLRYRLQLLYTHLVRGLDCASTDTACAL